MDIRLEILRINGVWTLTSSGPSLQAFGDEEAARAAAIARARDYHASGTGEATVHLWRGERETTIFDTRIPSSR